MMSRAEGIRTMVAILSAAVVAMMLLAVAANAAEVIAGPVEADVVRVIDGDTIVVDAHVWPDITVRVAVRLAGMDAPELRGKCPAEKIMAREAKERVDLLIGEDRLLGDSRVRLNNIHLGKFAGRVVAIVRVQHPSVWMSLSDLMVQAGLARVYDGGRRESWCGE